MPQTLLTNSQPAAGSARCIHCRPQPNKNNGSTGAGCSQFAGKAISGSDGGRETSKASCHSREGVGIAAAKKVSSQGISRSDAAGFFSPTCMLSREKHRLASRPSPERFAQAIGRNYCTWLAKIRQRSYAAAGRSNPKSVPTWNCCCRTRCRNSGTVPTLRHQTAISSPYHGKSFRTIPSFCMRDCKVLRLSPKRARPLRRNRPLGRSFPAKHAEFFSRCIAFSELNAFSRSRLELVCCVRESAVPRAVPGVHRSEKAIKPSRSSFPALLHFPAKAT